MPDVFLFTFSFNLARKFSALESYFCFGCAPDQPQYVKSQEKVITLCADYVERIWGTTSSKNAITSPTFVYDGCGMFNTDGSEGDVNQIILPS